MLVTVTPTQDGVDTGGEFAFGLAMGKTIATAQAYAGTSVEPSFSPLSSNNRLKIVPFPFGDLRFDANRIGTAL